MVTIGIIGINNGNGHPYSWSSIINGHFDRDVIIKAGYGGIVDYLEANKATLGIDGAEVNHVWTQDKNISVEIARSAQINNIVDKPEEMIGKVDAILLSRDDYDNHVAIARPFIEAGVPIFIDKPLAVTHSDLQYFSDAVARGKFVMSCSSMRYSEECKILLNDFSAIGRPMLVTAVGKKDWNKYGIHMLEGIMTILNDPAPISVQNIGSPDKNIVNIEFADGLQVTIHLFKDISLTFQASFYGDKGWRFIEFRNFYEMFRQNIIKFIDSVKTGIPVLPFHITQNIVNILIAANESLSQGGRRVQPAQQSTKLISV